MASDTTAATEARKRKAEVNKKYGEYIPKNADPEQTFNQWCRSLFGESEPNEELLLFALGQAKIAGIDLRVPGQMWIKDNKVIITIEGLITIAEKTGQYGGTTAPEFEEADGKIDTCTIGIYKVIGEHLITPKQTVHFNEYDTGEGMWKPADDGGKPHTMIKKVAHAHVLRASFSACANMYIAEEVEKSKPKQSNSDMQSKIEKNLAKNRKNGKSNLKKINPKPIK